MPKKCFALLGFFGVLNIKEGGLGFFRVLLESTHKVYLQFIRGLFCTFLGLGPIYVLLSMLFSL